MKVLFIMLVFSIGAILLTAGVLWLRVRWHLRRSDHALKNALADIQPQKEPMDKR